jgi:hypothetical protein
LKPGVDFSIANYKSPITNPRKVSGQLCCSKKIWLSQGSGWRGRKFGRCLALEWKT